MKRMQLHKVSFFRILKDKGILKKTDSNSKNEMYHIYKYNRVFAKNLAHLYRELQPTHNQIEWVCIWESYHLL